MRKDIVLALIISFALIIAILSLPDILEPMAKEIIRVLGSYWYIAILIIGIVHGLKPDEHTWPITVSYALMQKDLEKAFLSTWVFALALTLVWSALSALTGQLYSFFSGYSLDPIVDVIVGITMLGVSLYLLFRKGKEKKEEVSADYKVIWIHGTAAAFGGDFIIVLLLTLALAPFIPETITFSIGLIFGLGSLLAQSLVVSLIYKGVVKSVKDTSIMLRSGRLALGFLGIFMITLGLISFLLNG